LLKPRSALRAREISERVIKLMGPVPA